MIRTYQEVLDFLYQNLPMFQRVGAVAYKNDLTNTLALCRSLENPQDKFRSIHVAGTNGKGSSSHMLASILQEAGYKTGLYTSPHLKSFTERIRINGLEVEQNFVVDFVNKIRKDIEEIKPSFFEITVAMAFDYFAINKVDIAVVEVGLGGRLDSTNVIKPELSLITNIGWDHKDLLGDTLEKIAFEKAGIMKTGVPVVVSERQEKVSHVFEVRAVDLSLPLRFASDDFSVKLSEDKYTISNKNKTIVSDVAVPLLGIYQSKNIAGVTCAVDELKKNGFSISNEAFRQGLQNVLRNTNLKGRWQKLGDKPLIICDTGHNVDGIREITKQIQSISYRALHVVFGVVKDKDISEILELLPKQATYYFCEAKIPRALPATELASKALVFGLHGEIIPDVNRAKAHAIKNASPDDFIFIGGSTFVVAEIDEL